MVDVLNDNPADSGISESVTNGNESVPTSTVADTTSTVAADTTSNVAEPLAIPVATAEVVSKDPIPAESTAAHVNNVETTSSASTEPITSNGVDAAKESADNISNGKIVEEKSTEKAMLAATFDNDPKKADGLNGNAEYVAAAAEGETKKLPYPKSVFFIISNEFCERFNYYGMRTILVLYLSRNLGYPEDDATVIFHIFTMLVYFLCIFGAIISDSWLGKFKTILYLSIVYVCGSVLLTLGAIPPLNLPADVFTMLGLSLIALGSGGIKPCVSAFGGDQFQMPEQVKQMTTFFSLFYFAINAGSLISTTVTPILREDVHCYGEKECYPLAFGVPAILMITSIIIFILGKPLYKTKPPAGNMVVLVSKTIGNAISTRWKEKKTNPRNHWLDYADKKFDKQMINDVKVLMRILVLYLPLPVFWALFDQQGSRWTFQATRMDGDMGTWDIKPDQLQVLNPLLILIFIPLYDVAFYPLLAKIGIRRSLQKLTMGGILAGIAFIISGVMELKLEETYPVLPSANTAQLRIFNGEDCSYTFRTNLPDRSVFTVNAFDQYVDKDVRINNAYLVMTYSIDAAVGNNCPKFNSGSYNLTEKKAFSVFMASNQNVPLYWYEDYVNKPSRGSPLVRPLANVPSQSVIEFKYMKTNALEQIEPASLHNLTELSTGSYEIYVDSKLAGTTTIRVGGVYSYIISANLKSTEIIVTEPNSINILWLIPQYVVMTLAEVMFSVTGLEFSYSQAPTSMKSVLTACWLLTVAFGNVIVVIVAELALFESQASEFFLFAGLMFVDMLLFMWLAYLYTPNDPTKTFESETEPLNNDENESKDLDNGIDNKALSNDDEKTKM